MTPSNPADKQDGAREYWLFVPHKTFDTMDPRNGKFGNDVGQMAQYIHVIEYSALDHMANCFAVEQDKRLKTEAELAEARRENKELWECVKAMDKDYKSLLAARHNKRDELSNKKGVK